MDITNRFKYDTKKIELGGGEDETPAVFEIIDPNSRQGTYKLAENLTPLEYRFIEKGDMSELNKVGDAIDVQVKIVKALLSSWQNVELNGTEYKFNQKNVQSIFEQYPSLGVDLFEKLFEADTSQQEQEAEVKKS